MSDDDAEDVRGAGQIAVTGAVAHALHPHRRNGAELRGVARHEQRARGSHRLHVDPARVDRRALQQPERRRCRNGEHAVGGAHHAAADVERRRDDAVRAQPFEAEHGARDVDDRIEFADLVQMNLLQRHLVNGGLGLGQPTEELDRAPAGALREGRPVDQPDDLLQRPMTLVRVVTVRAATSRRVAVLMLVNLVATVGVRVRVTAACSGLMVVGLRGWRVVRMLVRMALVVRVGVRRPARVVVPVTVLMPDVAAAQPELGRRQPGPKNPFGRQCGAGQHEAAKCRLKFAERKARVEQRAKDHVARGASEAIEIQDLGHRQRYPDSFKLQYRPSPRTTWSTTRTPINSPAAATRLVNSMSSPLGCGSPDG